MLQFQFDFGLHDLFHHLFRHGLALAKPVDGLDHLAIRRMLVAQVLGACIVNVVLLGDSVQTIDAWIPPLQMFLDMRAGPQALVTGPMEFATRLGQPFLNVQASSSLNSRPYETGQPSRRSMDVVISPLNDSTPLVVDVSSPW